MTVKRQLIHPITTPHFIFDGRGPSLHRWLHQSDRLFEGTFWKHAPDSIIGAEYSRYTSDSPGPGPWRTVEARDPAIADRAWVVFAGLQVVQFVPEEVHSYWHLDAATQTVRTGVWEVQDSAWIAT